MHARNLCAQDTFPKSDSIFESLLPKTWISLRYLSPVDGTFVWSSLHNPVVVLDLLQLHCEIWTYSCDLWVLSAPWHRIASTRKAQHSAARICRASSQFRKGTGHLLIVLGRLTWWAVCVDLAHLKRTRNLFGKNSQLPREDKIAPHEWHKGLSQNGRTVLSGAGVLFCWTNEQINTRASRK
jgi:hypothetical protein